MKEVMGVDVFETLHDLEQDALDTGVIQALVIPRFHQLVQISLHVLHTDMKLFAEGVEENVERRDEVCMRWQSPEEDHFSQLQARCEGLK